MSVDAPLSPQKLNFFTRHERLTLGLVNLVFLLLLLAAGEVVARFSTGYEIGYYTEAKVARDGFLHYPWGVVPVNSSGYMDEEFNLNSTKKRVGWFGDSVAMGVGAGYPYRVSDIIRTQYPKVENWNFGKLGTDFYGPRVEAEAAQFKLDTVVYIMNLNDILPATPPQSGGGYLVYHGLGFVKGYLDYFRDRSYLYNAVRTSIKNAVQRLGFEASGYYAYELWPGQSDEVFRSFAESVNEAARHLREHGVQMCVLISPYEMQVSSDAARTYANLGFKWEDGFVEGATQRKVRQYFDKDLPVYDGLNAFPDKSGKVGSLFVYNAGDKIDWNHPNRSGHAALAKGFAASGSCPFLKEARG
jgi:hypothetical protein